MKSFRVYLEGVVRLECLGVAGLGDLGHDLLLVEHGGPAPIRAQHPRSPPITAHLSSV